MSDASRLLGDMGRAWRGQTAFLEQGKQWRTKTGELLDIAAMESEHRINCLLMLLRNASSIADRYGWGWAWFAMATDAPDEVVDAAMAEDDERMRDPIGWLLSTPLVQAMLAGLPADPLQFAVLERRARHWATCPVRTGDAGKGCTCGAQPAAMADWRTQLTFAMKKMHETAQ